MFFSINRRGFNRTVILTKNWAIKLPTCRNWRDFLFGLLNNMNEAKLGSAGKPGLCPVAWASWGGFVVVMPRAEICQAEGFDWGAAHRFLETHLISAECKPDSFGYLNGELVCVDYGWP